MGQYLSRRNSFFAKNDQILCPKNPDPSKMTIWRTRTPCYSGSKSLGILRVAYFCGKKIRSFLPEMCVLRFWCKMNGKKNDQCQMVIVAGCLRWKNMENVQYIIYMCYVYYSRQSPFQKRCISTKGHPTSPSPEKGPMVMVGYQKRTEKKKWYSSWINASVNEHKS